MKDSFKKFFPKKYLGQNFLVDPKVREKIILACDLKPEDIILEIGPGKGFLTKAIAPLVKKIIAVEKDFQLAQELKQTFKDTNVTIIEDDILKYPFSQLPRNIKIVGNLPYNIATAIIEKIILTYRTTNGFYMTIQREHAQRLAASPNSKEYGSLTCFVQYYAKIEKIFDIKNTAFRPIPKVRSSFIRMNFYPEPLYKTNSEETFFKTIRQAFFYRRKTLPNALSTFVEKKRLISFLEEAGISPQLRPENLSLADYIKLSEKIDEERGWNGYQSIA